MTIHSLRSNNRLNDLLLKRKEFLEERPHLLELQNEIDEALMKAGNQGNRCTVINKMMIEKVRELNGKFKELIEAFDKLSRLKEKHDEHTSSQSKTNSVRMRVVKNDP